LPTLDIRKFDLFDDIGYFDCGNRDLNEYILYQALEQQNEGSSTTYLARHGSDIVGFVSLAMSSLRVEYVERKHLFKASRYQSLPSLMIGRLAVDKEHQGRDFGTELCDFAVANAMDLRSRLGCQFVIVNAKPGSIQFYEKIGFQLGPNQLKQREPFMYFKLPLLDPPPTTR
jgi:GNAT superfamily N-acetyltransferase